MQIESYTIDGKSFDFHAPLIAIQIKLTFAVSFGEALEKQK